MASGDSEQPRDAANDRPGDLTTAVERPMFWSLGIYRVLAVAYATLRFALGADHYRYPAGGWAYITVLVVWTLATLPLLRTPRRCGWWLFSTDLALGAGGVLLTAVLDAPGAVAGGSITLPTVWAASGVLGFALRGGWRWGAASALLVAGVSVLERGTLVEKNVHNGVLLLLCGTAIGYVVTLARLGERALVRALRIEATTRERERLARDIHDGVLQVLALVRRRGAEAGGEAAELGRLAGEQESALRGLVSRSLVPGPRAEERAGPEGRRPGPHDAEQHQSESAWARPGSAERPNPDPETTDDTGACVAAGDMRDLAVSLAAFNSPRTTVSTPGTSVLVPRRVAEELTAVVSAALDNVSAHVGETASAWVLLEAELLARDRLAAVLVTVRDDGPGIPAGRLRVAAREGRLGIAQSIRGRVTDLGGSVEITAPEGQGTEIEVRVPV